VAARAGSGGVISKGARNAIDSVAPLRTVVKSRAGQHLIQTARGAKVLREPLRFVALQFGPPRMAGYRLRDSGLKIFIRHQTRDVNILNEIFGGTAGRHSYEPPTVVGAMLDANPAPAVLDLGANIGLFGAYVLSRWPGASIQSFEPDPTNLRLLTHVIAANELERRWSVADVAVANRAAEMSFAAGLFADSHLTVDADAGVARGDSAAHGGGHTITVRAVDIFAQDHDVDLLKMDIEGGEWAILADGRLANLKADVLVLEWHTSGCPEPDARSCAIRHLRVAGYSGLQEVESGQNDGLLWAWRETGHTGSTQAP
jgi:FkbM family methyltransferase